MLRAHGVSKASLTKGSQANTEQEQLRHCRHKHTQKAAEALTDLPDYVRVPTHYPAGSCHEDIGTLTASSVLNARSCCFRMVQLNHGRPGKEKGVCSRPVQCLNRSL